MAVLARLYKLFRNNEFLGVFTANEIMEKVGISRPTFRAYTTNALTYRGEWRFDYADDTEHEMHESEKTLFMPMEFCKDWENTRLRLLNSGHDLSRYVLAPEHMIWS